jgi:NADH dehydrogenase FAD-containing subunit
MQTNDVRIRIVESGSILIVGGGATGLETAG